ncbi:hypothetical protein HRbin11_00602 [bacterium HR11]|nr:hypothetical protein HRbin11_00602 [bacterium HR11]
MGRWRRWEIAWLIESLGLLGATLGVLWGTPPGDGPFIALAAPTSVALGVRPEADAASPEEGPPMLAVAQTERGQVFWWTHPRVRYVLEFLRPVGVALDGAGRLWVGDDALNAVFSVSARGRQLDFRCWQDAGLLDRPVDFAFGEEAVLILDNGKGHVLRMDMDGRREVLIGGLIFPTALQLVQEPMGLEYRLLVTDMGLPSYFQKNQPVVRVYQTDLRWAQALGTYGQGLLEYPVALVVQDDTLDVLDGHLSQRLQFDLATGGLLGRTGEYGTGPGQWRNPSDMAKAAACRVVADTGNDRLVIEAERVPVETCRWASGPPLVEWHARLNRCEPVGSVIADSARARVERVAGEVRP